MAKPDYYHTLGLLPDAEPAVIRAAYRALINIYHPDKNRDEHAGEKTRLINIAYEVLSDPAKKKEYDASLSSNSQSTTAEGFDDERPFSIFPYEDEWSIAIQFHPELNSQAEYLAKIAWRLSFAFKLEVMERKSFAEGKEIAQRIKNDYLIKYFGRTEEVQKIAEELLLADRRDVALYLNEIITVMGDSVSISMIMEQINKRFDGIVKTPNASEARELYKKIAATIEYFLRHDQSLAQFIRIHEGKVNTRFFSEKLDVELEGKQMVFKDTFELRSFILKHYAKYA